MSSLATPSPSPPHSGNSVSRRPQRKSTLTQQQKNQKRQRATQDQLIVLEAEFNKNPTPTAIVRERIADEINMTERSVQIWFQNRRAKIKTLAKKSIETGEDCDAIPDCMRHYLHMQAIESGKGYGRQYYDRRLSAYGGNGFLAPEPPSGKIVIHHFSCRSLSIGTWRRVGQNSMDLIVFYSPDKACLTYYINNDAAGYKIEFPFSSIKNIELETLDVPVNAAGQRQGQLVITLTQPPNFYMDSSGSGGFIQCGDFTEDQQADQVLTHYLGGEAKKLSGELAKLVTLQSFAGRHMHAQMPIGMPMYPSIPEHAQHAQQIPHIVRPASSNAVYHHEAPPTQQFHRRHQRTRSRSVPIAIDFSQLQQNMPSFSFQEPHGGDHLYAPAPQHPHQLAQAVSMDNPLRIDTSNNFLDYRPGSTYPVSATTASPSDQYPSPSIMSTSVHQGSDNYSVPSPYSLPFLSPMSDPATMANTSMSPMPMGPDPIIASGSPPLSHIDRTGSADIYTGYENSVLGDDLNDLYSKQTLSPYHGSPHLDDSQGVDMQQMMHFPQLTEAGPM